MPLWKKSRSLRKSESSINYAQFTPPSSATSLGDSDLPRQITEAKHHLAGISKPTSPPEMERVQRILHGGRQSGVSGKGRPRGSGHSSHVHDLSWRDDQTMRPRGSLRGFEILSRGRSGGFGMLQEDERLPELFVRGRARIRQTSTHEPRWDCPEHRTHPKKSRTIRNRAAESRDTHRERAWDYQSQADRPFEHESG